MAFMYEKYINVLKRERLYRKDFPISEPRSYEDDILTRRQLIISSLVPCKRTSRYILDDCVLVRRNSSSINYDQEVTPSTQISNLPNPTQIPRPPLSPSNLPYLPLAKYKSPKNGYKSDKVVKSLPVLPAARNSPQYPFHNSYVLAKLKRSDVPK